MFEFIGRILTYSRYLTLGLMDAGLTTLSILSATYLTGITDGKEIFRLAMSVGIGIAASNFSGAYLAEGAETGKELARIESAMGLKRGALKATAMEEKLKHKALDRSLINSLSAFLGIALATIPMLFIKFPYSYFYGFIAATTQIVLLGFYIGRMGKSDVLVSTIKVLVVSFAVILINVAFSIFN